jgi:hypothetical protein
MLDEHDEMMGDEIEGEEEDENEIGEGFSEVSEDETSAL